MRTDCLVIPTSAFSRSHAQPVPPHPAGRSRTCWSHDELPTRAPRNADSEGRRRPEQVGNACHLPTATCHPPATCHLPLATCDLLFATCYSIPATCHLLPATCYLLLATNFLLCDCYVIAPPLTDHPPPVCSAVHSTRQPSTRWPIPSSPTFSIPRHYNSQSTS